MISSTGRRILIRFQKKDSKFLIEVPNELTLYMEKHEYYLLLGALNRFPNVVEVDQHGNIHEEPSNAAPDSVQPDCASRCPSD